MKIELDRQKKIVLLKWLKQGFIETTDIEEIGITIEVIDRREQVRVTDEGIDMEIERKKRLNKEGKHYGNTN